ncbi:hypothetical protein H9Q13_01095 [Pontibacter sp. JH31]|uniref:Uncharacterized protein n=1 Tax=Pontibacter aquaedesilientis TaxID=2766980 RepID=A0ABR7XBR4_9BACT|nr:hypothetical protein [Pontibacter aquaedesilientis]MBD1395747.1 hypothetical protein [Pontibacter aquaedesilientis]
MRWTLLLLLLLCSCVAQREAEKQPDKKIPKYYPPAIAVPRPIVAKRSVLVPVLERSPVVARPAYTLECPACEPTIVTETLYLPDTVMLDSLNRELEIELLANQAIRKKLKSTEAERDFWQEKNRQKFWTLIAMAVFGLLYILFKVLASRVRET